MFSFNFIDVKNMHPHQVGMIYLRYRTSYEVEIQYAYLTHINTILEYYHASVIIDL